MQCNCFIISDKIRMMDEGKTFVRRGCYIYAWHVNMCVVFRKIMNFSFIITLLTRRVINCGDVVVGNVIILVKG